MGVDIQGVPTSLVSSAKLARYPKLVGKPRRMNNESLSAAFRSFARFINSRSMYHLLLRTRRQRYGGGREIASSSKSHNYASSIKGGKNTSICLKTCWFL